MKYRAARDPADALERFVFVDGKGEARELYERECEYLATEFDPTDGDRPYIKERYESRTPDGHSMHGFLERRYLPRKAKVEPRPDPARFMRPRLGSSVRALFAVSVLPLLVTALVGSLAFIGGAFLASPFMRPGHRGLGIVLFVAAVFFSLPFYLILGPINVLLTADVFRFLRFFAITAGWLGALAGAAWVLWLHGDPSRILLFR
jgi:hypothetical protein